MTDTTQTEMQSLKELYQAGYEKSVVAMVDDIIAEYKLRLEHGSKKFIYYKKWQTDGYFMSPVYTEGKKMVPKNNTICQNKEDIIKFQIDIIKHLNDKYGIFVYKLEAKYVDNGYGWHFMNLEIILSLETNSDQ